MARPGVARSLVVFGAVAATFGLAAGAPPAAAQAPAALSKVCKALQAKAIAAAAEDPAGHGTPQEGAYYKKCPAGDVVQVISLGTLSTYSLFPNAKGQPAGIVKVTSSRPSVIALGKPQKSVVDGKTTNATVVQAVGLGSSRVCVTVTGGSTRCFLVVTPKAITGKAGGRSLNVAFGNQPNDAAKVVSITSSDASVVSVATDPSSSLPYVVLGQAGTTTICAKYTKGTGGCQQWTIAS